MPTTGRKATRKPRRKTTKTKAKKANPYGQFLQMLKSHPDIDASEAFELVGQRFDYSYGKFISAMYWEIYKPFVRGGKAPDEAKVARAFHNFVDQHSHRQTSQAYGYYSTEEEDEDGYEPLVMS